MSIIKRIGYAAVDAVVETAVETVAVEFLIGSTMEKGFAYCGTRAARYIGDAIREFNNLAEETYDTVTCW